MMNDIKQLKATQPLKISQARVTSSGHLQPNSIVDGGVSSQVTGTTQYPDKDYQRQLHKPSSQDPLLTILGGHVRVDDAPYEQTWDC